MLRALLAYTANGMVEVSMSEVKASIVVVGCVVYNVSHSTNFYLDETGMYSGDKKNALNLISTPVWISEVIVNVHTETMRICIKGINRYTGTIYEFVTDNSTLSPSLHNPIAKEITNRGGRIRPGENNSVLEFLSSQYPPVVYGIDKVGWCSHEGRMMFVTPKQVYGATEGKNYRYAPEAYSPSQDSIGGATALELWQTQVFSQCLGNPVVLFALGIAFAAPLMALFNMEGGGFHFWGHSSRGKTTILQIAASVWGNAADPAQQPGNAYIQLWNTTSNGLEGTAQAYNDLPLPMDELGTSNIKNFGQAIYQLAGGKGKTAMTSNRDMRTTRSWKTLIVSSGEHAISHEVEVTTGAEARTGQLIRFIDILVEDNIFPAFVANKAAQKVTDLKLACSQYYGVAGHVYLEHLVKLANEQEQLRIWLERFTLVETVLAESVPTLQPEQRRAVKRFALVAVGLILAIEAGVISVSEKEIMATVEHVLRLWLVEMPTVSEAERGVEHLKQYILRNPNRFEEVSNPTPRGTNLVGYYDAEKGIYLILKEAMAEVVGRSNFKPILAKLDDMGMLVKNNTNNDGSKRPSYKMVLANKNSATGYAVSRRLFRMEDVADIGKLVQEAKDEKQREDDESRQLEAMLAPPLHN